MSIHYGLRLGPQKPLTQFLEEIKAMVMDYANSIRERQNLPAVVQIEEIPDRGPTKDRLWRTPDRRAIPTINPTLLWHSSFRISPNRKPGKAIFDRGSFTLTSN